MKIRGQTIYPLKDRLERLSALDVSTGCIEWTSSTRNGYGRLMIGSRADKSRKSISAHRLSYEINKGKIPAGMYVCHSCDNRKCVNPDHLFLGSPQDNVNDRESKNRNIIPNLKHESHPNVKLSWVKVREIRKLSGVISQQKIADIYNVSRSTIKDIVTNKTWIPQPPKKD